MEETLEKSSSEKYTALLGEVEATTKPEEKLKHILEFMRISLASTPTPSFRDFWEAKRLCLGVFKEKMAPRTRSLYWNQYVELSDEARRVKEILDDQSSFAHEQIQLALEGLQKDLENYDERLQEVSLVEIPSVLNKLQNKGGEYAELQREIEFLNAIAQKLNSLRKELARTQMRVRFKNRLFNEIKHLGDEIFPKRKEKIEQISTFFSKDVEAFLSGCNLEKGPFFPVKEEIKILQKCAKALSLSPTVFTQTREKLSGFWDQIKDKEASLREERAEQREKNREEIERLLPKIEALKQACVDGEITLKEAESQAREVLNQIKALDLSQDEGKKLKRQLAEATKPLEERTAIERKKAQEEEALHLKRRMDAKKVLLEKLAEVLNQAEVVSLDALVEKWESLVKEEKKLGIEGMDKSILINRLDGIADHIQEKKWLKLLEEESEDQISSLRALLSERHKEKRKIKERLEGYRKLVGGSSLNMEQSMQYQDLISSEKIRLDTIETMLEEIEEKLFDLEE